MPKRPKAFVHVLRKRKKDIKSRMPSVSLAALNVKEWVRPSMEQTNK